MKDGTILAKGWLGPHQLQPVAPLDKSSAWRFLAPQTKRDDFGFRDVRSPLGKAQIGRCAEPHFRLRESVSGRIDYIETIRQWNARIGASSVRKTLLKLALLPRWLKSSDFRLAFTSGVSANKVCFERELLDHYRLVFEKH